MYDLEQYANDLRGFYISLDELPGPIARDEEELIAALDDTADFVPDGKYLDFVKRYNPYEDGGSSGRVLAAIIKENQ